MRTGNPFKLALCLALAIPFALAACGGGGGGTPAKTAMTPPETPETPETPAPTAGTPAAGSPLTGAPLDSLKHIINDAINDKSKSELRARPPAGRLAASGGDNQLDIFTHFSRFSTSLPLNEEMVILKGTEFPVPPTTRVNHYTLSRDEVAEAWLHYFIMPIDCLTEFNCYRTDVVGDSYTRPSAAEFFKRIQGVFAQDYGLSPYSNDWPGVSTARTREICYSGFGNHRACSAETLGNPDSFFTREAMQERRRTIPISSGGEAVNYVTSDIAYLQYSAFFLNRTLRISSDYAGRYCGTDADCIRKIPELTGFISDFEGNAFSMGRSSIVKTALGSDFVRYYDIPLGTWKGGMMAVKFPLKGDAKRMIDDNGNRSPIGNMPCTSGLQNCTFLEAKGVGLDVLSGNVTFVLNSNQMDNSTYSIEFSNISNQEGKNEDGWTWTGRFGGTTDHDGLVFSYNPDDSENYDILEGMFYGPNYEEVGGTFRRLPNPNEVITGAFGARKQ